MKTKIVAMAMAAALAAWTGAFAQERPAASDGLAERVERLERAVERLERALERLEARVEARRDGGMMGEGGMMGRGGMMGGGMMRRSPPNEQWRPQEGGR
jgi:hypothetical protein